MQMKDDRFPKIVLVGQPSKAKRKAGCRKAGVRFKGNGNFLGGCKEGGFK